MSMSIFREIAERLANNERVRDERGSNQTGGEIDPDRYPQGDGQIGRGS